MIFSPLPLAGCYRISSQPRSDARGMFARFFCVEEFARHGLVTQWAQCNFSVTHHIGTLRGMHFQHAPAAETKLIRCISGAAFDVLVDMRAGSPTFGKWISVEISADNRDMVYAAPGCAHGFQTRALDTELIYFHSAPYAPQHEGGLHHADPDVAIDWPLPITAVSDKDMALGHISQVTPFS
jgi:dTDP-4-dehydrorhamnose 3,5-epimerase